MNIPNTVFTLLREHIEDSLLQFKGSRTPEDRYEIGSVDTLCLLRDWIDEREANLNDTAPLHCRECSQVDCDGPNEGES